MSSQSLWDAGRIQLAMCIEKVSLVRKAMMTPSRTRLVMNRRPSDAVWLSSRQRCTHCKRQAVIPSKYESIEKLSSFFIVGQVGVSVRTMVLLTWVFVKRRLNTTWNFIRNDNAPAIIESAATNRIRIGNAHCARRTVSLWL